MAELNGDENLVDAKEGFEEWKKALMTGAESLLMDEFPRKVVELNNLLNSDTFNFNSSEEVGRSISTTVQVPEAEDSSANGNAVPTNAVGRISAHHGCVYTFADGQVPVNEKLANLQALVKTLLLEAVEQFTKIKMWILFLIPRMEDGNNFGVNIQGEILDEVRAVEMEAFTFWEDLSDYLCDRGEMVVHRAKYPHIRDFELAIRDIDEGEFINIYLILSGLRHHYSTLHDLIVKNIDKVKTPRLEFHANFY